MPPFSNSFNPSLSRIQVVVSAGDWSIDLTEDCNECGICVDHCFYDALQKAVLLSEKVTDGEKSMILGYAAGIKGDLEGQRGHYELLVRHRQAQNLSGR